MADQERKSGVVNLRKSEQVGEENQYRTADHSEETSAEIAAPIAINRGNTSTAKNQDNTNREATAENNRVSTGAGTLIGFAALALSIIALFVSPILFGAAGIVLGFIARRRGAQAVGSWAIGIGAVAIIIGIFVLPFY